MICILASQVRAGQLYKVISAPPFEYVTVGEVYRASGGNGGTVGLHRPGNGGGTYMRPFEARRVVLEHQPEVQS